MANGYSTGMSRTPIDFSTGARAFMQSAIESRINEIRESKKEISKNQDNILKAMSVKALPELAKAQRDRYQTEIESYRKGVIDKFKESGGKLTLQQQKEIQDGFVDLNERMASEVNELKQFDSFKKIALDPNFQYAYDPIKYEQIMGETYTNLMEGKGVGDLTAKVASAIKAPSTGDYLSNRYGQDIKALDLESLGDFDGNIFTQTELSGLSVKGQESLAKAQRLRDTMLQDPYFRNKQNAKQEVEDFISQMRSETKPYRQAGGGSGGDRYKNVVDYTPTPFNYNKNDYNIVRIPSDVTQTERNFFVDKAKNLDTGSTTQLTQDNAQIIGVDVENGKVLLQGKGGFATKGGETAYVEKGTTPRGKSGDWQGAFTEKDLNKSTFGEDFLKGKYTGGRPVEKVKNITKTKNEDGSITISGTIVYDKKGWGKGSGEEEVSITYEPFADPASAAVYEAPLYENKEAVANMFPKVSIKGKPLAEYFNGAQLTKETKPKGQQLSVSAYNKAKGKNYTRKQIEDAFGEQYEIVD